MTADAGLPEAGGGLLDDERLLLSRFPLGRALDAGLVAAADEHGDPAAQLRVAACEMLAGRDDAARARARRLDEGSASGRRAVLLLTATWAGRLGGLDLSIPPPGDADATLGGLLELAAVAFGRLCVDGDGTGHDWAEQSALTDRLERGTEAWLAAARTPEDFIAGLPVAVHTGGIASLSERSDWSADLLRRLGLRARRYGLLAWLPVVEFFEGFARQHLGEFDRARRLIARALPGLRRDSASPWLPFALATECFVASLGSQPVDLQPVERELLTSSWRSRRPIAAHTGIHLMAAGLAEVGDAVGARRLLDQAGRVEELRLVHEDRVRAQEIVFAAALAERDRDAAEEALARVERLMASSAQRAAVARMRTRLGAPDDPIAPARASGTAIELIRARWTALAIALARGDREDALGELAALDAVAAELRATAVRVGAVRMLRDLAEDRVDILTPRQREVAALAAAGFSNRQIAAQLYLGVRTVESHVAAALRSLGLRRRGDLGGLPLAAPSPAAVGPERGIPGLTVRQGQVAALIAARCTNAQIAQTLGLSEKTVEKHVAAIKAILGVPSRATIAAAFLRAG